MVTDGSSFMKDTVRGAGDAMANTHGVRDAKPFPPNTSGQKDALIALTWALTLEEGYTDSEYAILVLHAHTAIRGKRELLRARNSSIKYEAEILHFTEAVQTPKQALKGNFSIYLRNPQGRLGSKESSLDAIIGMILIPSIALSTIILRYSTSKKTCTWD